MFKKICLVASLLASTSVFALPVNVTCPSLETIRVSAKELDVVHKHIFRGSYLVYSSRFVTREANVLWKIEVDDVVANTREEAKLLAQKAVASAFYGDTAPEVLSTGELICVYGPGAIKARGF